MKPGMKDHKIPFSSSGSKNRKPAYLVQSSPRTEWGQTSYTT